MLFERTALSRKPAELARKELLALREEDKLTPDLVFRDPYFLDFLKLKETRSLFRKIGEASLFGPESDLWRLCVPPATAMKAVTEAGAVYWYADWAGGLLWLQLPATADIAQRLRTVTAKFTGHASLFRANDEARENLEVFEPEPPVRRRLTEGLKDAFDPQRVFNPGRMYKYL